MTDSNWRDRAACSGADPRLFDEPGRERAGGQESEQAVAVRINRARTLYCDSCPVRNECITDAVRNRDGGIRAGQMLTSSKSGVTVVVHEMCGTESGYQRHRHNGENACRACKKASSQASLARRSQRFGRTPPVHGLSGYRNYGCRCAVCKEAQRLYAIDRRRTARKGKTGSPSSQQQDRERTAA